MAKVIGFDQGPTSSGMMTWYCAVLDCGHNWYAKDSYGPIRGVSANLGDDMVCETCSRNAEAVIQLLAVDVKADRIMYARYKPQFGGSYHLYKRVEDSPTGVLLHSSYPATQEVEAALNCLGICAVSPTERTR